MKTLRLATVNNSTATASYFGVIGEELPLSLSGKQASLQWSKAR